VDSLSAFFRAFRGQKALKHQPLYSRLWVTAKINQQPKLHPGRLQIIQNLCLMFTADGGNSLQFYNDGRKTDQIRFVGLAEQFTLVCNAPASAIDLFFDFPKYVQVTF
jgi:hypothetical protein